MDKNQTNAQNEQQEEIDEDDILRRAGIGLIDIPSSILRPSTSSAFARDDDVSSVTRPSFPFAPASPAFPTHPAALAAPATPATPATPADVPPPPSAAAAAVRPTRDDHLPAPPAATAAVPPPTVHFELPQSRPDVPSNPADVRRRAASAQSSGANERQANTPDNPPRRAATARTAGSSAPYTSYYNYYNHNHTRWNYPITQTYPPPRIRTHDNYYVPNFPRRHYGASAFSNSLGSDNSDGLQGFQHSRQRRREHLAIAAAAPTTATTPETATTAPTPTHRTQSEPNRMSIFSTSAPAHAAPLGLGHGSKPAQNSGMTAEQPPFRSSSAPSSALTSSRSRLRLGWSSAASKPLRVPTASTSTHAQAKANVRPNSKSRSKPQQVPTASKPAHAQAQAQANVRRKKARSEEASDEERTNHNVTGMLNYIKDFDNKMATGMDAPDAKIKSALDSSQRKSESHQLQLSDEERKEIADSIIKRASDLSIQSKDSKDAGRGAVLGEEMMRGDDSPGMIEGDRVKIGDDGCDPKTITSKAQKKKPATKVAEDENRSAQSHQTPDSPNDLYARLEQLIDAGNWDEIVRIAKEKEMSELRKKIEKLFRRLLPEEVENFDDVMAQWAGREEELFDSLLAMEDARRASASRHPFVAEDGEHHLPSNLSQKSSSGSSSSRLSLSSSSSSSSSLLSSSSSSIEKTQATVDPSEKNDDPLYYFPDVILNDDEKQKFEVPPPPSKPSSKDTQEGTYIYVDAATHPFNTVEAAPVPPDQHNDNYVERMDMAGACVPLNHLQAEVAADDGHALVEAPPNARGRCFRKVICCMMCVPIAIFVELFNCLWNALAHLIEGLAKCLFTTKENEASFLNDPIRATMSVDRGSDHVLRDRETLRTFDEWQISHKNLYEAEMAAENDRLEYSGFHKLCNAPLDGPDDKRWDYVRDYLADLKQKDPRISEMELQETQRPGLNYTPLHVVCMLSPPNDVVEDMIEICPILLQTKSTMGDTPLSLACGGFFPAPLHVIELIVKLSSGERNCVDSCHRTPLHNYFDACSYWEVEPYQEVVKLLITEEVANKQDIMGHTPLWKIGRVAVKLSSASNSICKSVEFILSERGKHYDSSCFLEDIRHLPYELQLFAFQNKVVKRLLNEAMSRAPYTAVLLMDFYVQCMIVAAYTNEVVSGGSDAVAATVLLLLGSFYWIIRRSLSFASTSNKGKFLLDPWKLIDLVHCILLISSTIYLHRKGENNDYSDGWRNMLIATSCFTWLVMISILRASSKDFAVFVDIAIEITLRLISFILASFIVLTAFATMFYISVANTSYCSDVCTSVDSYTLDCPTDDGLHFCTLRDSMLKVYAYFVGGLEESSFAGIPPATVILTGIFAFIVTILLLNIIIAIVTDAYASVNKKAEVVFWAHRFDFLHEVNRFIHIVSTKYSYGIFDFQDSNDAIKSRDKDKPWRKKNNKDTSRWEGKKSKLLKSLVRKSRTIASLRNLIGSVAAFIFLAVWFVIGLFTLGVLWPRTIRMAIFCPRLSRESNASVLIGNDEDSPEMRQVLEKNKMLEMKILSMHDMIQDLMTFTMERRNASAEDDEASSGVKKREAFMELRENFCTVHDLMEQLLDWKVVTERKISEAKLEDARLLLERCSKLNEQMVASMKTCNNDSFDDKDAEIEHLRKECDILRDHLNNALNFMRTIGLSKLERKMTGEFEGIDHEQLTIIRKKMNDYKGAILNSNITT